MTLSKKEEDAIRARSAWDRRHHSAHTDFAELAWSHEAELADLRAYRERTEAALRDLCDPRPIDPYESFVAEADLRDRGLWREPGEEQK